MCCFVAFVVIYVCVCARECVCVCVCVCVRACVCARAYVAQICSFGVRDVTAQELNGHAFVAAVCSQPEQHGGRQGNSVCVLDLDVRPC